MHYYLNIYRFIYRVVTYKIDFVLMKKFNYYQWSESNILNIIYFSKQ